MSHVLRRLRRLSGSAVGLLVLAVLSGCSTLSTVSDGGIQLPSSQTNDAADFQLKDERTSSRQRNVEQDDTVLFGDAVFSPSMPRYLERAVGLELAGHEWRAQAEDWLKANRLSLVNFEAKAALRSARPADAKRHAGLAAVSPAGPLLGMAIDGVLSELARGKFVEVRAVLRSGSRDFQASTLEPILESNTSIALQRAVLAVSRMLAQDIAEEAVGLSQPSKDSGEARTGESR